MKAAVRAAIAHTLLDASKEAMELAQKGGLTAPEACDAISQALAELMIINALSGEKAFGEDLKDATLAHVSKMYDEFKKRMTQ